MCFIPLINAAIPTKKKCAICKSSLTTLLFLKLSLFLDNMRKLLDY